MVDLGAEVSVILLDLVKKLGLSIFYIFVVIIAGIIRVSKRFIGLYENVFININKVIYKIIIWMIYRLKYSLVLGRPFHK